jgi:hypothetical protein
MLEALVQVLAAAGDRLSPPVVAKVRGTHLYVYIQRMNEGRGGDGKKWGIDCRSRKQDVALLLLAHATGVMSESRGCLPLSLLSPLPPN